MEDHTELRETLIQQADRAMMSLLNHVNILLDAAHVYAGRNPAITPMERTKHKELKAAVFDMGSIPKMVVDEIGRWKRGEERILGRYGVEVYLLNELHATMESLLWFYEREGIDVTGFSLDEVRKSHYELIRCNRLL